MKRLLLSASLAISAFAFAGMQGSAHNLTPMKNLTDDTIVAKVNGKPIKVKDVNAYLQGMTKDFRIRLQDLPAQHVKKYVTEYVDSVVYYPKAKSITKEPYFKAFMQKIAVDFWMTKKYNEIKISLIEAKDFYQKYKDVYFKGEPKIIARHIVVKSEAEAEKIIKKLSSLRGNALIIEFAKIATEESIDPTKIDGGQLGEIVPTDISEEFANTVAQMKDKTISKKPLKVRYGYEIILVEKSNIPSYIPFDKVKESIINYLKQEKLNKELDYIYNKSKVKILLPSK